MGFTEATTHIVALCTMKGGGLFVLKKMDKWTTYSNYNASNSDHTLERSWSPLFMRVEEMLRNDSDLIIIGIKV